MNLYEADKEKQVLLQDKGEIISVLDLHSPCGRGSAVGDVCRVRVGGPISEPGIPGYGTLFAFGRQLHPQPRQTTFHCPIPALSRLSTPPLPLLCHSRLCQNGWRKLYPLLCALWGSMANSRAFRPSCPRSSTSKSPYVQCRP